MSHSNQIDGIERVVKVKLRKLLPQQVKKIDEFLVAIGAYGEVRLVVQNGELRYINKLVSHSVSAKEKKKQADS